MKVKCKTEYNQSKDMKARPLVPQVQYGGGNSFASPTEQLWTCLPLDNFRT